MYDLVTKAFDVINYRLYMDRLKKQLEDCIIMKVASMGEISTRQKYAEYFNSWAIGAVR